MHSTLEPKKKVASAARPRWFRFRLLLALAGACVLVACGGGGGAGTTGGSNSSGQSASGTIANGIVVIPATEAASLTLTSDPSQPGSLTMANPVGAIANAQNGQIVALPANDAQGNPFGFTGKVQRSADGSISITPAALEEVFTKLSLDFDSARDGAQIAGLISPKGGRIQLTQPVPFSHQSALEYATCQLGLNAVININCRNGEIEGTIGLEHKLNVKKKGSNETSTATLYLTLDIRKLAAKYKIDYDLEKYPSTGGLNQAMVSLTGEWGGQFGIRLDDQAANIEVPSWSELLRSDTSNIWDVNTKLKFGKYFELSGLNGDDKKGLIPLGGFYLTAKGGERPFAGDLSAAQLGQIKGGAIIIWIYIDLEGNLTLSGDLSLLKFTGASIEKGFNVTRVNEGWDTRVFNTHTLPEVFSPYLKGSLDYKRNTGLALAADLLVGGIRPFSVKAEIIGVNETAKLEGDAGFRILPAPAAWDGTLCFSKSSELYSDIAVRSAVKASLDTKWLKGSTGFDKTIVEKHVWASDNDAKCVNSYELPLTATVVGANALDTTKSDIQINFSDALNNTSMRNQTGTWRLYVNGTVSSEVDIDTIFGGIYTLPLPGGTYNLTLRALHKDINGKDDKPLIVKASDTVSITVPTISATVDITSSSCTTGDGSSIPSIATVAGLATGPVGSLLVQNGGDMTKPYFTPITSCGAWTKLNSWMCRREVGQQESTNWLFKFAHELGTKISAYGLAVAIYPVPNSPTYDGYKVATTTTKCQ